MPVPLLISLDSLKFELKSVKSKQNFSVSGYIKTGSFVDNFEFI